MSRGAVLPVFQTQRNFVGGELAALQPAGTDLLPQEVVCRRLSISRWTLARWVRNWEESTAAGFTVKQLTGLAGHFPAATHGARTWKRWERRVLDAWCEAARKEQP